MHIEGRPRGRWGFALRLRQVAVEELGERVPVAISGFAYCAIELHNE